MVNGHVSGTSVKPDCLSCFYLSVISHKLRTTRWLQWIGIFIFLASSNKTNTQAPASG